MSGADHVKLIGILGAIGADDSRVHCVTIPGEPKPKERARFGPGGQRVYTPSSQRLKERAMGLMLKQAVKVPFTGNVAVACLFYRSSRHRVDTDNMLKTVMDSANGICWRDDYQVTAMAGFTDLDRDNPRTVVALAPHHSGLTRSALNPVNCEICAKEFIPQWSGDTGRFCSKACVGVSKRKPKHCQDCGGEVRRRASPRCRACYNASRSKGGA